MDLKSLNLKKTYSSDFDDILDEFYIPALKQSTEYFRLAGFFSSTSLAVSARGILGFIKNGGIMKLIVSPRLRRDDLEVIINSNQAREEIIERRLLEDLDQFEDDFARDHVSALGWMVANGRLKIKVAVPKNVSGAPLLCEEAERSGIFHQKVGVLRDSNGNAISFSGSVNETASGWMENIEEFKVFRDWDSSENDYVQADIKKFIRFWENLSRRVIVIDVPHAVEERLISIAPNDIDSIRLEKYSKPLRKRGGVELFQHQIDAVNAWLNNDMRGIFAMATGTGKTFAALGCLDRASRMYSGLLAVIACPYQHLEQQWRREIDRFDIRYDQLIIADGSNRHWRDMLADGLINISLGQKNILVVITTHSTFISKDFISIIQGQKTSFKKFVIADEVHGLGAKESRLGLIDEYDLRLGLSATPRRWFDITGTNAIYNFFKGEVFQFGLEDAINQINPSTGETYLVPYRYIPRFAFLGSDEMEDYNEKTKRIVRMMGKAKKYAENEKFLELLIFARADIIKNAYQKYEILDSIFGELDSPTKWTIVYCSPQQIDNVMGIVNNHRIIGHRFTMKEGTTPTREYNRLSERDFLLKGFGEGIYQMLVAMKCLDEGVDVPPARTAILMASSGNPLEYIQRIGRILRRYPGKKVATIYDIVVLPPLGNISPEFKFIEQTIIRKELHRYEEIAKVAMNNAEALAIIYEAMETLRE